jgi:ATP:corrinoid adenosyltransferase
VKRKTGSVKLARAERRIPREVIHSGTFNKVLPDEVVSPTTWRWTNERVVIETTTQRPARMNAIFTGRNSLSGTFDATDTASDFHIVEHSFDAGMRAPKGIDFQC